MPYLIAALVLVGALCLLDLVLTLAVVRRLREHTELLSRDRPAPPPSVPVGTRAGDFEVPDVEGRKLSRADLPGTTLIGFFSPDCSACEERLPEFVEYATRRSAVLARTVAVIVGTEEAAERQRDLLVPVARVVIEPPHGPAGSAFGVRAFPTLLLLEGHPDGEATVLASGFTLDALTEAAPV